MRMVVYLDIFPQTAKVWKRLWIYSLEPKNREEIQHIQTSHVETVALMSQSR